MFSTHLKGEIGKLKAQIRATELGFIVSFPAVESRYDMILDDGKTLHKAQIKYSNEISNGAVEVSFLAECRNSGYQKTYDSKEIDVVIAYLPATDKCYWLSPKEFQGKKSFTLRLEPPKRMTIPKNREIHLAKDFEW